MGPDKLFRGLLVALLAQTPRLLCQLPGRCQPVAPRTPYFAGRGTSVAQPQLAHDHLHTLRDVW